MGNSTQDKTDEQLDLESLARMEAKQRGTAAPQGSASPVEDASEPAEPEPAPAPTQQLAARRVDPGGSGGEIDLARLSPDQIRAYMVGLKIGQAGADVPIVPGRGCVPKDGNGLMWLASMYARSGVAKGLKSPEEYATVIQCGMELGLTPLASLSQISIVEGKLTLWGTGPMAVVRASGLLGSYEQVEHKIPTGDATLKLAEWPSDAGYTVTLTRKDTGETATKTFTVADARLMGKWMMNAKMPWCTNPKEMLLQKARIQCIRSLFPDVLLGLYEIDEIEGRSASSMTGESLESRRAQIIVEGES